jgi:Prolyl oligopeptidase family
MAWILRLLSDPTCAHQPGSVDPPKTTFVSLAAVAEIHQSAGRAADQDQQCSLSPAAKRLANRRSKLHAGASWVAEYGDADDPEDWKFLERISAYHAAVPGRRYPPILIATSRRDDRVHPGHARKMAARLQAIGYEAYFYEPAAGAHGHGKDNRERASFTALGYNFLRRGIGWLN